MKDAPNDGFVITEEFRNQLLRDHEAVEDLIEFDRIALPFVRGHGIVVMNQLLDGGYKCEFFAAKYLTQKNLANIGLIGDDAKFILDRVFRTEMHFFFTAVFSLDGSICVGMNSKKLLTEKR